MAETIVMFRKWRDGTIDALFPAEEYLPGMCTVYSHIGQHSSADYTYVVSRTVPAKPAEYASLERELESPPYHYALRVTLRYTPRKKR